MKKICLLSSAVILVFLLLAGCTESIITNDDVDGDVVVADGDQSEADGEETVVDGDEADKVEASDEEENPIPVTYAIVDSNQNLCYSTDVAMTCVAEGSALAGQDAQYSGNQPRYQDNNDGTISDLVTGLMWQKDPGDKMGYADAVAGAENFELAGYDDWRLPDIKELYSLIMFSGVDPSGYEGSDTSELVPFINSDYFKFAYGDTSTGSRIIDSQWVTSSIYESTVMGGNECYFGVNFADGRIKCYPTQTMPGQAGYFVIHVRETGSYGHNAFVANTNGTVSDTATGLVWQQADSGSGMTWEDALAYCEDLMLAGKSDWRLPAAKELQSIVNYSRSPDTTASAAIDPVFSCTEITNEAGQPDYAFYWSSTTHSSWVTGHEGANASYVSFGRALGYWQNQWQDVHGAGAQRSDPKVGDPADYPTGHGPQGDAIRIYNYVRCVRGGNVTAQYDAGPVIDGDIDGDVDEDIPPVDGDVNEELPGDEPVSCDEVPEGMPCCGDAICDGPETEANCAVDCGVVDGDDPAEAEEPAGPVACTTDTDCQAPGACPTEAALGCSCSAMPDGGSFCIPMCNNDADCPQPVDVTLICSPQGICVPQGGPQG